MRRNNILRTLWNTDAAWSTIWSILQQLVVAASTYFIVEAIRQVTAGNVELGFKFTGAFVLSLFLVYLPNTLSMVYLQKWRLSSIEKFVVLFISRNKGRTSLGHSRNKVSHESWITNESFTVFENATSLLYQILSMLMNSVFNIAVIALALDGRILAWYLVAGIILVAAHLYFKPLIGSVSLEVQDSRKALSNSMLVAWQNIFIGNKFNFDIWNDFFANGIDQAKRAAARYDLIRSIISSATVSLALIVVAVGNGLFLLENKNNLPAIAALLITLPRQLQIIQSIFGFFNLALSWTGTYNQLKSLESVIALTDLESDNLKYIKFDSIDLFNGKVSKNHSNFESIALELNSSLFGRWTLRGKNGVGKSTLLNSIKEFKGDKGFFLPSNYEDLCFGFDIVNHSDGNRLKAVFEKIAELEEVDTVILDEWDASLDDKNLEIINEAIDRLAQRKVVIESRHRREVFSGS